MASNNSRAQLTKFLVIAAFFMLAALAVVLIYPAQRRYEKQRLALELLKQRAAEQLATRNQLSKAVSALESSPGAIEKVAREKFGLCKEGETVLRYSLR